MDRFHNPGANDQTKVMHCGTDLRWFFQSERVVGWRTLNRQYLEFVLSVPE